MAGDGKGDRWSRYGWAYSLAIWLAIGGILVVYSQGEDRNPGTLMLVAYAAFSVSALFGFLFGMKSPGAGEKPTHMQQVADWLTKLLLGAGLVELKAIWTQIEQLSAALGAGIDAGTGKFVVLAALGGAGAIGLLSGYLWSQLHYGNVKDSNSDDGPDSPEEPSADTAPNPQDSPANEHVARHVPDNTLREGA